VDTSGRVPKRIGPLIQDTTFASRTALTKDAVHGSRWQPYQPTAAPYLQRRNQAQLRFATTTITRDQPPARGEGRRRRRPCWQTSPAAARIPTDSAS
jgi:hypothetical protein